MRGRLEMKYKFSLFFFDFVSHIHTCMCIVQRCYIDHSMQVAARTSNATTNINDKATAKQECSTCLCIYVLFCKRHTITNDQKKQLA